MPLYNRRIENTDTKTPQAACDRVIEKYRHDAACDGQVKYNLPVMTGVRCTKLSKVSNVYLINM